MSHSKAALLRDLVEVVAIVAAGVWALYTFVYVQKIKPAEDRPAVLISGQLHKLGRRGDLVQFSFTADVRNIGSTPVVIAADAFTVVGTRFAPGASGEQRLAPGYVRYARYGAAGAPERIFEVRTITHYGNPAFGGGYAIGPGEAIPYGGTFVVRAGSADTLALIASVAYAKRAEAHGFDIVGRRLPEGGLYYMSQTNDPNLQSEEATLDRIGFW